MTAQPTPEPTAGTVAHSTPRAAAQACGCLAASLPARVLEVHLDLDEPSSLPVTTVGVGYELRAWRAEALADHIMEWVPDFALRPDEQLDRGRAIEKLRRAYRATFGTARSHAPAEILLHAICREFYGSTTVVHKVVFKTADKDPYKGFDGVHLVHSPAGGFELWLGEAKFYRDLKDALRAVDADLEAHLEAGYLKNEFAIVGSQLDPSHPHYGELLQLLEPTQTIEKIFTRLVVPVFVTYDSPATLGHDHLCPTYLEEIQAEAAQAADYLRQRIESSRSRQRAAGDPHADLPLQFRLFLLPMADKDRLQEALGQRLSAWLP